MGERASMKQKENVQQKEYYSYSFKRNVLIDVSK
jgi:hypothetical protein